MSQTRIRNGRTVKPVPPRGLPGNPEWEAMKAQHRNLRPAEAVRECEYLSNLYRRMHRSMSATPVHLNEILDTLKAKKITFVLTGMHGISTWTGRPRATFDVDILVKSGRTCARAVKALRTLYPTLEVHQHAGVTGFYVPGETQSVLDVTYPHRLDIQQTLETAVWTTDGVREYRIPTLECALANKYGAMLTLSRSLSKRGHDAADFADMVLHSMQAGRQPIDLERLRELGELVWPGGGGAEILRLVEQVKAGRLPNVNLPEARP